jgi:hypothetical protein
LTKTGPSLMRKHSNNIISIWKGEMRGYKMNKNLVSILSNLNCIMWMNA